MILVKGGFKELIKLLKKKAVSEEKKFEIEIRNDIDEILKNAEKEADEQYQEIMDKGLREIEELCNNKIEEAEVTLRSKVLESEQESFEKFMELLMEKLILLRKEEFKIGKKSYEDFLKKIYKKAENKVEKNLVVFCNPNDVEKIKKLFKPEKIKKMNMSGGIIVENSEKTVRFDRSFEKILKDKEEFIQEKFLRRLE